MFPILSQKILDSELASAFICTGLICTKLNLLFQPQTEISKRIVSQWDFCLTNYCRIWSSVDAIICYQEKKKKKAQEINSYYNKKACIIIPINSNNIHFQMTPPFHAQPNKSSEIDIIKLRKQPNITTGFDYQSTHIQEKFKIGCI